MLTCIPPAVYRCPIFVSKPSITLSSVYNSPLDQPETKSPPYPAWPAIENLLGSYCMPTLMRATYHYKYVYHEDYGADGWFSYWHEDGHRFAMWSYSGVFIDTLGELVQKIIRRLMSASPLSRKEIAELWEDFDKATKKIDYLVKKFEPIEEIFATYYAMRYLPDENRKRIETEIKQVFGKKGWYTAYKAFVRTCDNCQRFSPTAAAFFILDRVCLIVTKYNLDSIEVLMSFLHIFRKYLPYLPVDYNELISRKIIELYEIPHEVFETVYEGLGNLVYRLWDLDESYSYVRNANDEYEQDVQKCLSYPTLEFVGQASRKDILPSCDPSVPHLSSAFNNQHLNPYNPKIEDFYNLSIAERIFYDSLWQQLSQDCGIVCPLASEGKPCCGIKKRLQRLHKRLPEEDKKRFREPKCDLIR